MHDSPPGFLRENYKYGEEQGGEGAKGYKEYKVEHRKNKRIKRECMQDEEKALLS